MPRDGEKRREWKLRPGEKRKAPLATFASIFSESSARVALSHVSREALAVVTVFSVSTGIVVKRVRKPS